MQVDINVEYISVGGNVCSNAADWDAGGSGLLAFGADINIALWKPLVRNP